MEVYCFVKGDIFFNFLQRKPSMLGILLPLMFLLYYPDITATWLQSRGNKLLLEQDGFCLALCILFAAARSSWGMWTNFFFLIRGESHFSIFILSNILLNIALVKPKRWVCLSIQKVQRYQEATRACVLPLSRLRSHLSLFLQNAWGSFTIDGHWKQMPFSIDHSMA